MIRDLISDQRVKPRKKPSLLSKAMTYRPDSRTKGDGVTRIRQRPARTRRAARVKKAARRISFAFTGKWDVFGKKLFRVLSGVIRPGGIVPAFIIAVLAGLSVLALALDPSFSLPWERNPLPEPEEDGEYGHNLASYAGLLPLASAGDDIPLDLMETFSWSSYKVRRGDSVSKIAAVHGISMDAVIACNGITNARRLREGQTLRIPNMDGIPYTVKNGDSLSKISAAFRAPLEAILDANDIESDDISQGTVIFIPGARMKTEELKLALGELFIYPIRGRLTSPYGWRDDPISGVRRYHAAIDLAAPTGTTIRAAMDGRISSVGYNATYGNYIIMSHGGGYQTMYAHLHSVSVKKDAPVNQGAKIGEAGSTGYSTGPHLHFAVFKNGKAVNPLEYLH
ncbi:MAG: M23 family metallopeptidase [Treponema sp.]|jgi:murein DD-endopeptidase MepM/ murein hydrolase activator NlpD|nr:M23 family metallopeptidase [Treponema sp.]